MEFYIFILKSLFQFDQISKRAPFQKKTFIEMEADSQTNTIFIPVLRTYVSQKRRPVHIGQSQPFVQREVLLQQRNTNVPIDGHVHRQSQPFPT